MQRRLDRQLDVHDNTATNGRTRVWHAEALDGLNPLPDAQACERLDRNELACAGVQPQTRHEDPRI